MLAWLLGVAFANPAFDGVWKLDLSASEGVSHILEAQGISWVERTLAERGAPTHAIRSSPGHVTVDVQSGWYARTDEFPLDDRPRTSVVARVGEVTARSRIVDGALVTHAVLPGRDGRPVELVTTRRLRDPNTLLLTMALTDADGRLLTSERVFRRQE